MELIPVGLDHDDGLIDLRPAIVQLGNVRAILSKVVPELEMETSGLLDVDGALSEAVFVSELGDHVHASIPVGITTRAIPEILAYLLIPVEKELLIEWWGELACRVQLRNCLRLFVHPIHQEEGVLDLQRGALGELLDPASVHVLGMLKEELLIIGVFLH